MWRRCQGSRCQDDIVTLDGHSSLRFLVHKLREVLSEEVQNALHRDMRGLDLVRVHTNLPVLGRR